MKSIRESLAEIVINLETLHSDFKCLFLMIADIEERYSAQRESERQGPLQS